MKKITTNTITTLVSTELEENKRALAEHNEIKDILKSLDGKDFNRRTLNPKKLGRYTLLNDGNFYFQICGEFKHTIRRGNGVIDWKSFEESDTCYFKGASERIEKLKYLDIQKIVYLFGKLEKAVETIDNTLNEIKTNKLTSFENPIFYDLMSLFCNYTNISQLKK